MSLGRGFMFSSPTPAASGTSGNNDNTRLRKENQERMRIEAENKSKEINKELVNILARGRKSVVYKAKSNAKKAFGIVPTPWADAKREATIKVNKKLAKKCEKERKELGLGFESPHCGGKTKKNRNKKNNTKRRR